MLFSPLAMKREKRGTGGRNAEAWKKRQRAWEKSHQRRWERERTRGVIAA